MIKFKVLGGSLQVSHHVGCFLGIGSWWLVAYTHTHARMHAHTCTHARTHTHTHTHTHSQPLFVLKMAIYIECAYYFMVIERYTVGEKLN